MIAFALPRPQLTLPAGCPGPHCTGCVTTPSQIVYGLDPVVLSGNGTSPSAQATGWTYKWTFTPPPVTAPVQQKGKPAAAIAAALVVPASATGAIGATIIDSANFTPWNGAAATVVSSFDLTLTFQGPPQNGVTPPPFVHLCPQPVVITTVSTGKLANGTGASTTRTCINVLSLPVLLMRMCVGRGVCMVVGIKSHVCCIHAWQGVCGAANTHTDSMAGRLIRLNVLALNY
jgi:hypothetical protein